MSSGTRKGNLRCQKNIQFDTNIIQTGSEGIHIFEGKWYLLGFQNWEKLTRRTKQI